MNTGHDGSMGTLHANNPREALSRCELMITMGGFSLPSRTIREMICASIDVVVQAARLRDGSRRITHITEVMGMEGETIITQDLFLYDMVGEDANGNIIGRHRSTGIGRPRFWDRARYYGEEKRLAAALDAAEVERRCLREARHELCKRSHWPFSPPPPSAAWHGSFCIPSLSGREQGRQPPCVRREAGTGRAPGRQEPALAPRTGRGIAEGSRCAPPEGKEDPAERPPHPGRPRLVAAKIHDRLRRARRLSCFVMALLFGGSLLARRRPGVRRGLRPAALGAGLSQEAPGKEFSQSAAGRRRRDRSRHQGGPAAV